MKDVKDRPDRCPRELHSRSLFPLKLYIPPTTGSAGGRRLGSRSSGTFVFVLFPIFAALIIGYGVVFGLAAGIGYGLLILSSMAQ